MKIHYVKSIVTKIIEAKAKNDADLGEARIDYIELTTTELDELKATCGPMFSIQTNLRKCTGEPWGMMFNGVRIAEAK